MRAREFLIEARQPILKWLKSILPNLPDYVIKDMIYGSKAFDLKNLYYMEPTPDHPQLEYLSDVFGDSKWKHEKIHISIKSFDPETKKLLKKRIKIGPDDEIFPDDSERFKTQSNLIKARGISSEPIIVIATPKGYSLMEGWHRVIEGLKSYPAGFDMNAWVAYNVPYPMPTYEQFHDL